MPWPTNPPALLLLAATLSLIACQDKPATLAPVTESADPAEIAIGERLFLETRFAQFFAANGEINKPLESGDSVMSTTVTLNDPVAGPFMGESMNCAACHLINQHADTMTGRYGMRAYNDFARVSPIPKRNDGSTTTTRNSPTLVNISQPTGSPVLFHMDGEFPSLEALVGATLTGRNYGWLANEQRDAVKHIANVIRNDDGSGELAKEFGGSYRDVLSGNRGKVPEQFVLPKAFTINLDDADDAEVVGAVNRLIAAYTADLAFEQISPYDKFLAKNNLPAKPNSGESQLDYSRRLAKEVNALKKPLFITASDGDAFEFHAQNFVFGEEEIAGLKVFFTETGKQSVGNCIACHAAPHFSDGGLHNTGVSQLGYDEIHGDGSFMKLEIPKLSERNANPQKYLPLHASQPDAAEPFRQLANKTKPQYTDLGAWNIFENQNFPHSQQALSELLQAINVNSTSTKEALLNESIATFKTPTVRNLGQSEPYMHDGEFDNIEAVMQFYLESSTFAQANKLRNGDPRLLPIKLNAKDIADLSAFLRALNEDYN